MTQDSEHLLKTIMTRLEAMESNLMDAPPNQLTSDLNRSSLLDLELRVRRARDHVFPEGYFADTAWELLLELAKAHQSHQKFSVSDIGLQAHIPATTVLRYVDRLVSDGFAERMPDPTDKRRVFIRLSDQGLKAVDQVFDSLRRAVRSVEQGVDATDTSPFKEYPGQTVFT